MISAQSVCLREIWERELGTEGGGGLLCCRAWLMLGSKPASLHHSFFFVVTFLNGDDPVQSQSMFVTAPSVLGMDRRSLMTSWSWARHFHQTVSAYIPDLPLLQRGEDVLHNCSYSTWMKHVSMHVLPVIHAYCWENSEGNPDPHLIPWFIFISEVVVIFFLERGW